MSLRIDLLGPPKVERSDGGYVPRGRKPWALLAYLVRSEVQPSRERLAGLLFPEAHDPLGALRSCLAQVRRTLGSGAVVEGDPVRLRLPGGTQLDVEVLTRGAWVEAVALPGIGQVFLEGLDFPSSPGFQLWLDSERRHLAAATEGILHEAALACLARGDRDAGADHAAALVAMNPYEENFQTLLVRCLRASGRREAAAQQVAACTELFRRELGVEPSPALAAAASDNFGVDPRVSTRAAASAQLEAGESAVEAGALDVGLQALRGAISAARRGGHRDVLARSLVALGSALVHAARGSDEEGAAALHEGIRVADGIGDPVLSARACRELGYVEMLRARYERAETFYERATRLADGDDAELGWIEAVRGVGRTDVGDHAGARRYLTSALQRAERTGDGRLGAFVRSKLGRLHLLRGELAEAAEALDRSLELTAAQGWTSFLPYPESLRAEVDLLHGELAEAEERFEHAFALSCQLGDPCWESLAARGMGLVADGRGQTVRALELLDEAPRRCRRLPDSSLWIEAYALEARCAVAIRHDAPSTAVWLDELEDMASRTGMRDLAVRAAVYRAELGQPGAADAARSLAAQVDNPALHNLVAAIA